MEQIHCLFTCKSWTNLKIKKKTLFLSKYFIYFEILRIRNVAQFMKIFVTMLVSGQHFNSDPPFVRSKIF